MSVWAYDVAGGLVNLGRIDRLFVVASGNEIDDGGSGPVLEYVLWARRWMESDTLDDITMEIERGSYALCVSTLELLARQLVAVTLDVRREQ